jgi:hypothetical protein
VYILPLVQFAKGKSGAIPRLFDFFVDGMLVAVRAELLQLHSAGRIPTIFHRRIARHTIGPLVPIGATFRTFERDHDADTFSHNRKMNS